MSIMQQTQVAIFCVEQLNTSGGAADAEGPAWAPLRDNYMLTNSKLKDWDKMPVRYDILSKPIVGCAHFLLFRCSYHFVRLYLQDNMTMATAEDNGRTFEDSSSDEDD